MNLILFVTAVVIFLMRSVKSTNLANFKQTKVLFIFLLTAAKDEKYFREECVIDSKLRENYNKC